MRGFIKRSITCTVGGFLAPSIPIVILQLFPEKLSTKPAILYAKFLLFSCFIFHKQQETFIRLYQMSTFLLHVI